MVRRSHLSADNRRSLAIAVLLICGLFVSEVSILPSVRKSDLFGLSIAWAWAYLAFIWGAAIVVILIPGISRILLVTNRNFKNACRLAVVPSTFRFSIVLAQLLVSLLMNFLVLSIVFLPALAGSISPALAIIQTSYCGFLNSYVYSLFLWLFAGIVGPALIYAARHETVGKISPGVDRLISILQAACYLAILVASVVVGSAFLGARLESCGKLHFFFNQYVGAVIPSTFAGLAIINFFESKSVKSQTKAVLVIAALIALFSWLIFLQVFYIAVAILIISILTVIAITFYEKNA